MSDSLFLDSIQPLFAELSRGLLEQQTLAADEAWTALVDSGFLGLLLPEDSDGASLTPLEALPVLMAAGYYCLPLPFVETALLNAALDGSVPADQAMATGRLDAAGMPQPLREDLAHMQGLAVNTDAGQALVAVHGDNMTGWVKRSAPVPFEPALDTRLLGTVAECLQLAGAMQRVLELTVDYANTRQQFGRAIGKYQTLQQQIAVMTGHCHSAVMAAQLAAAGIHTDGEAGGLRLDLHRIAAACATIKTACQPVISTAHAVHGAIGITQEYILHHYSRRLLAGRLAGGSESHWFELVGRACLDSESRVFDFARETLS